MDIGKPLDSEFFHRLKMHPLANRHLGILAYQKAEKILRGADLSDIVEIVKQEVFKKDSKTNQSE